MVVTIRTVRFLVIITTHVSQFLILWFSSSSSRQKPFHISISFPFHSNPRNQTTTHFDRSSMSVVISQKTPGVFVDTHVFLRHDLYLEQQEGDEGDECEEESSEDSSIGLNEESSLSSFSSSSSSPCGEEQEEVQSKLSLESLDDSLPIKRGLSNYFNGKSKSFQCLSEVAETSDLVKKENPFNKKRRILMSCKSSWTRRASCASLLNTSSMPGLLHSLEEEEEDEDEENAKGSSLPPLPPTKQRLTVKKSFRSPRCFSLGDLNNYYAK